MKPFAHIIKKELTEIFRDKRTLMTMFVIPIMLFPILLTVMVKTTQYFNDEANSKTLIIGFEVDDMEHPIVKNLMEVTLADSLVVLRPTVGVDEGKELIQKDSIHGFLELNASSGKELLMVWHKGTELEIADRITKNIDKVKQAMIETQLQALNIKSEDVSGFEYQMTPTASPQEMVGKLAGGFLPYVFIAFAFLGCMYPAIDLFTGEKERGTIETLLTAPIARWQILFGKMSVVVLSGLLAAMLSLLGLYISMNTLDLVQDPALLTVVKSILTAKFIFTLFALQLPLTIFIAGILIPLAIYAKSFKEAQSIITPLNIVIVLPAVIGFLPGIELNYTTAMVPVINIVLATKELAAGTLDYVYLAISAGVMCAIAALAVFISYKQFEKETNVLM